MRKDELVAAYHRARSEWIHLLDQLDPEQLLQPVNEGGWTLKDMIAHLAWHEREMATVARQRALVGSPWWGLPLDQRNANIYELYKDRSLDEALNSAEIAHAELIQAMEPLSDEDMVDASHFAEMPEVWQPWQVFASNMHEHYQDHIRDLKVWLQKQAGSTI